jgi:hypothetical protein
MKNVFDKNDTNEFISRINNLTADHAPEWGKMSVDQMLAHCNVAYEMTYENKHPKASGIKKFLLKTFVKKAVVNDKPYKKNGPTAPEFKIVGRKNFEEEKTRLVNYIKKTQELGGTYFDGKESHSFGAMTQQEWNNMFSKHLDHHLTQFGV